MAGNQIVGFLTRRLNYNNKWSSESANKEVFKPIFFRNSSMCHAIVIISGLVKVLSVKKKKKKKKKILLNFHLPAVSRGQRIMQNHIAMVCFYIIRLTEGFRTCE